MTNTHIYRTTKPKGAFLNKKRKDLLFVALMLLIPVAHFLVFWLYVNLNSILMAFQTQDADTLVVSWSLAGFQRFFESFNSRGPIYTAIQNTLIAFVVNTFISFPISIVCCYILFKKVPGYKVFRILFFLPSLVSGLVLVMMYRNAIDFEGPLYYWVFEKMLGHPKADFQQYWFYNIFNTDHAFLMIQIFDVWSGVGASIVVMSGALYRIPKTIFESARMDGASIFREFFQIVLPLMWPTLSTYLLYKIASIFLYTGPILLFDPQVKNASLWTIGYYIFSQVKFENNYYYAASVGMVFTLIGLPIILIFKHFLVASSENYEY